MKDRVPKYPGRVKLVPVTGQENTFDMTRADEPTQPGDPLSKATFLTDATAAMLGLDENAVPDNAFAFLGKYNQHWWWRKATTSITAWREVQTLESNRHIASPDGTDKTITYSTKIQIDQSTGAVTLVNPQTFTVNYRGHQPPLPCYFTGLYDDPNSVFYFGRANNALFISSGDVGTMVWINPNSCYKITSESYQIPTGEVDYVHSSDRNAYPDSGTSGGYEWRYLGVPFENAVNPGKFASGSYVGTGKCGASNKNKLTFGFEPKMVIVRQDGIMMLNSNGGIQATLFWVVGVSSQYNGNTSSEVIVNFTQSGNTFSYYITSTNSGNAGFQMNTSGKTYRYIAIG